MNNFSDDDIKTIVPASRWNHFNLEIFRKRGKEAAELIGKSNTVNLGNLVTRNVQLLSDQQNVQVSYTERTNTSLESNVVKLSDKFQRSGISLWSARIGNGNIHS